MKFIYDNNRLKLPLFLIIIDNLWKCCQDDNKVVVGRGN